MHWRFVRVIPDATGGFQVIEGAVDHVQAGAQYKITRHQFYRRPLLALPETDEPVEGDVDAAVLDACLNSFGDGYAAALSTRRLVGLEAAVDTNQDFVRAGVHCSWLFHRRQRGGVVVKLGGRMRISTGWRLYIAGSHTFIYALTN